MQKKSHSMIEAWANAIGGYGVAIAAQRVVFPYFDIHVSIGTDLKIGLCFLVVSVVRSYIFRRIFNWYSAKDGLHGGSQTQTKTPVDTTLGN